jgi:hypothetical protein
MDSIGQEARGNDMHLYDPAAEEEDGALLDDDVVQERAEAAR